MPRRDILSLTVDDLATLSNRGTVKRAERELETGEVTAEIRETDDGTLLVSWSDGIICRFPAKGTLKDAVCSSGATGISRHVVRSVLAYQKAMAPETAESAEPPHSASCDPGAITDGTLEAHFRKAAVAKARARFERGVFVELIRGAKPVAQFLDEPCTLRFLVPGDLRYVHGDCAEPLLATYVPLAVWAFRELDPSRTAGIVSLRCERLPTPVRLLDDIDERLRDFAEHGLAGCPAVWRDAMLRLETRCRDEGLHWPAEIVADLVQQYERYHAHDSLFDPAQLVQHLGELTIRFDAIRSDTGAVPQPFVRGTRFDRLAEINSARLIGLGCGAKALRGHVRLTAFLQDSSSGTTVGVDREFADPAADAPDPPKDYHALASVHVARGIPLSSLAGGQLLLKSGKRTPGHRLVLPRGPVSLNPQAFEWEKLRAPLLAESFAELRARLELLPPASLRPRRMTENLHVCAVASVGEQGFDGVEQRLVAELRDAAGDSALLDLPYSSRARPGFEALAARLGSGGPLRFVSGHVSLRAGALVVRPVCAVFEEKGSRTAIQPWIDRPQATAAKTGKRAKGGQPIGGPAPTLDESPTLNESQSELPRLLSEILVTGLRRAGRDDQRAWQRHAATTAGAGFVRTAAIAERLAHELAGKAEVVAWNAEPAARTVLRLCLLSRLADDLSSQM